MAAALPASLYTFDAQYLAALHKGDAETERHLFSYFGPFVERKVGRYLESPDLVEEAAQETFSRVLIAVQGRKSVRHPERFGAFVHAISRNVAREIWRRENRFVALEEAKEPGQERFPNPHRFAESAETAEKVRRVLAKLPNLDRQLLEAVFLRDEDRDGLCRQFGVTAAYLRVLLHRAKQRFMRQINMDGAAKGRGSRRGNN